MMDLTEQQEQEMIDRAKAGDPEANYNMSLWALDQAMAEPGEERWNRLAAKCLVKAAEAGYAPAKEKMDELLVQTQAAAPAGTAPAAQNTTAAPKAEPAAPASGAASDGAEKPAAKVGKAIAAGAAALAGKVKALVSKDKEGGSSAAAGKSAGDRKASLLNISQWDDAQWKKMQTICIVICVVLAIIIAILLISGRKDKKEVPAVEETPLIPAAEVIATPVPATPTPEPVAYPGEAIITEITGANLEVFPAETDYVTEATTATVSTSGSDLNLRRGPASSFGLVTTIDNGTTLDVYAYKNGWALVKFGTSWGWCSKDYLK